MKWQVTIDGTHLPHTFPTEAEANQAAANERGNDWSKKIEVVDLDAPKDQAPPTPPALASPMGAPFGTGEPKRK